ncbi:MAG TPA: alkylhydroperoxidase domain protein [Devosiaceae bacterium]|jgi:alkylhydroperoxidase domain protein|nr:alkylhydroperoxidase domain protein [Devosiaceae bacterium]
MTDNVITYSHADRPVFFTRDEIGWAPWLEPAAESELTAHQREGLIDEGRVKSPYFRLLARDPDILGARTRTDKDIFYNPDAGLPRAERELVAAATSRVNGCIFCASVHARFAATYSKRADDVQKLLDEGVDADLGARWNAVIGAAASLTKTPSSFGEAEIAELRAAGLDDLAISDAIHASAFFNWANRLMLSLGEPTAPTG